MASDPQTHQHGEWGRWLNLSMLLAWMVYTVLTGWSRDSRIKDQQRQIDDLRGQMQIAETLRK